MFIPIVFSMYDGIQGKAREADLGERKKPTSHCLLESFGIRATGAAQVLGLLGQLCLSETFSLERIK